MNRAPRRLVPVIALAAFGALFAFAAGPLRAVDTVDT